MAIAFQEYSQSATLNIGVGGVSQQYSFEGTVNFDTSQWRVNSFAIVVGATQTWAAGPFEVVTLTTSADYAGQVASTILSWNATDYTEQHAGNAQRFIQYGVTGQKIKITANYKLPSVSLIVQGCTMNVQVIVSLESIVANPTSNPSPTLSNVTVTDNGTDPDPGLFDLFGLKIDPKWVLLGAGVLAAVLIVRPSAPATIISSGYREYRSRNRK